MHLAVDLTSLAYNYTGIEQYAYHIAEALGTMNECELTLLFNKEVFPGLAMTAVLPQVTANVMQPRHKNKLMVSQLDVAKAMKSIRADAYLFPAFPQPLAFKSRRALSIIHDVSFWDCPQTLTKKSVAYWRAAVARAVRAPFVITVSEFSKGRIADVLHVPADSIRVAYNGIDRSFQKGRNPLSKDAQNALLSKYSLPESYILSLCTLEPRKNLPYLINAWIRARQNGSTVPDLVLAGRRGWRVDELLSSVPSDLASHVHLTGFVDAEDLPHLYNQCDRFVYASMYEGFGLPPLEATVAGAPVLCSDLQVFHETSEGLVSFFSLDDNGEELSGLLSAELQRPSTSVSEGVCQRFNWESSARIILDSINEL